MGSKEDCRLRIAEMCRAENLQWGVWSGVGCALLCGGSRSRNLINVRSLRIVMVRIFVRCKCKKQSLVLSLLAHSEHDPMRAQPA